MGLSNFHPVGPGPSAVVMHPTAIRTLADPVQTSPESFIGSSNGPNVSRYRRFNSRVESLWLAG